MNDEKEKTTTEIIGECDSSYINVSSDEITIAVKREAKPLSEMTEKEILRRQLELLAEASSHYTELQSALAKLTEAMCHVYMLLQ